MMTFYEFYLQGKDQIRADSLLTEILKATEDIKCTTPFFKAKGFIIKIQ